MSLYQESDMTATITLQRRSTRRLTRLLSLLLGGAMLATVAAPRLHAQEAGIEIGAKAPQLVLERLDGTPMDLASVLGKKPIVLEFWATWCPLCKKLEPAMSAARSKYGKDVMFVGVGVPQNQSPERQQAFVTQQQMTGEYVFDRDGAAYKAYKATHTSYVVVIDARGMVAYTGVGPEQNIEAAVQKALAAGKRPSN
jgi:thiol-disulfide isomerase/thioredoxin